jgi:hypothetical protein
MTKAMSFRFISFSGVAAGRQSARCHRLAFPQSPEARANVGVSEAEKQTVKPRENA